MPGASCCRARHDPSRTIPDTHVDTPAARRGGPRKAPAVTSSPKQLHFRVPLWSVASPLLILLMWLVTPLVAPDNHAPVSLPFVGIYAALVAFNVAFQRWAGLVLTDTHAVVRGLTVRRIPWSAISGVGQQAYFGSDRLVLWTTDGRAIRTRAPITTLGIGHQAFQRSYHTIGQWWLAHRPGPMPS